MLAMVIAQQVDEVLDWSFAGALATVLTGFIVVLFFLFNRVLDLDRMWGGEAMRGGTRRPLPSRRLRGRLVQAALSAVDAAGALVSGLWRPARRAARRLLLGQPDLAIVALWIVAVLVLSFLMLPILVIIPISFTSSTFLTFPPDGLSLRWYRELVDQEYWASSAWLSLRVALLCMALSLALGIPAALALVRRRFTGQAVLYAFLISPLIVPTITTAVSIYYFFARLHLVGTTIGLVLAHMVGAIPLVAVIVAAGLRGFDRSLESASFSLGAGVLRTFARITLPIIRPAGLVAAFFAFMHSFDEVVIATFVGGISAETLPKKMWVSTADEISPEVADENSPLRYTSVASISARWLDVGEV